MHQAAGVGFANLAAFFAAAGNANIFLAATIAGDFHIFHFANDMANLVAMRRTTALVARAIAAVVGKS
jgi:hypothetical protein